MSIVLVGSTSGSITLQEPAVAGTTVLDLPATSGTILTTASSGQSIPKAALPTGSVLQVVQGSFVNVTSTTSTTYVDTGLSAVITPTSNTSKVLIFVNAAIEQLTAGTTAQFVIDRNGTKPQDPNFIHSLAINDGTTLSFAYYDSPASTSALTYKIQFKNETGGYTTRFGSQSAGFAYTAITLMEIAA